MKQQIKVTLYTTRQCPNCRQAKAFLQKNKVRFMEFDIERNQRAFKEFQRLGSRGVPVIMIGKTKVDGFNPKKLQQALVSNQLISPPQPSGPKSRKAR
ncbi:MAG: glutaredoxin family protein [Gammaproteobacteria bacterium]|nr:glutaredoxin family protein [Gammaproteobacteria bacterium]NNJ90204.1 glutaredoxin family protein [Gammaproteobacteria bacterium]